MGLDGRFLQAGRTLVPMRFQREEGGGVGESQSHAFARLLLLSLVCQEERLRQIRSHESLRLKTESRNGGRGYPFSMHFWRNLFNVSARPLIYRACCRQFFQDFVPVLLCPRVVLQEFDVLCRRNL